MRFPLISPAGVQNASPPVVSPDGRTIAFAADGDGKRLIWVRPLDSLEARPLAGTDGVLRPFWSPDSRFLAFMAGGKLKKVDIAGGPPQTICDALNGADGSWSQEGVILLDGRSADPLWRIPAAGGVRQPLVFGEAKEGGTLGAGWPEFLPDGKHFLFTLGDAADMMLTVGTLDSTETKPLFKTTSRVQYAEPGYLLFVRERTLVAQKFDLASLTVEGEPVPIGEDLGSGELGLASFSVSRNNVLVFRAGELTGTRLVWVDRSGKETPVLDAPADYRDTSLSADGTRLTYDVSDGGNTRGDIWIRDLARGVSSRFTFDATAEIAPQWSPDGRRIAYTSRAKGPGDLYAKDASGTREAELAAGLRRREVRLGLVARRPTHPVHQSRRLWTKPGGTPGRCRLMATGNPWPSAPPSSTRCGPPSRLTASTSPISPTSRGGRRSTCTSSPRRRTSGRSRPRAGLSRTGAGTAASCFIVREPA